MAHPQIAAFARLADGASKPARKIEGQKTLMARTMHGIVYDAIHDEIVVPQAFSQAVLTFRGGADGEEPPIRMIQGSLTQLKSPDRLDVDPVHNEIFVVERDAVLVFPRQATGNVAPIRVLKGPDTGISGFSFVAVDPVHNLLIWSGSARFQLFNRTDNGNVKPRAVIGGPKSGYRGPGGAIAVHGPTGMIIATSRGASSGRLVSEDSFAGVWSIEDNGDVPPRWTIAKGLLRQPRGVALDPKNKSLIVTDKYLNAVMTFEFPEIF